MFTIVIKLYLRNKLKLILSNKSPVLDVIIVGAGPAGLVTALGLSGFSTRVYEALDKPNKDKLCAGFVPITVFEEFNLPKNLYRHEVTAFRFFKSAGDSVAVEFDDMVGGNVDRTEFAEYLAKLATSQGVELCTGIRVMDFRERDGYVEVVTGEGVEKAKFLVISCGVKDRLPFKVISPFTRDRLGLCIQVDAPSKVDARGENWIFYGEKYSPFGYAWIFPKDKVTSIGLGALISHIKSNLRLYLAKLKEYHEFDLNKARFHPVPLSGPIKNIATRRVLLVGDSAGHVSPITGEGIKYAMFAGREAAKAISMALRGDISVKDVRTVYLKGLSKTVFPDLRIGRMLMRIVERRMLKSSGLFKDREKLRAVAELYASNISHFKAALKYLKAVVS